MLEPSRQEATAETLADDAKAGDRALENTDQAVSARVLAVQGITLLHVNGQSQHEATAVLELLRGFRATGRRAALCDTSFLVVGRQLGSELVQRGGAEILVSCGLRGRELAIGARDAGLDLASVVVCRNIASGSEVLSRQLAPGDTVLLWGVNQETCARLVLLLEQRLSERTAIAA